MIPVTTASDTAGGGARSTTGATVGAPGNYTITADATLRALGAEPADVVRTRVYVSDVAR